MIEFGTIAAELGSGASSPLAELAKGEKMLPQSELCKSLEGAGKINETGSPLEKLSQGEQKLPNRELCRSLEETRHIKTINDNLAGQSHPETGVPYNDKVVELSSGEKVIGCFPEFKSTFDAALPKELNLSTDSVQFGECNRQLKEHCLVDPELKNSFNERQLDDIEHGRTPYGYVWHHSEDTGKMQLVDANVHNLTRHTGGRYVWGGGTANR